MRGYRYRIYPTRSQQVEMRRLMTICCDTWNAALEQRTWAWRSERWMLDSRGAWHPEHGRDRMRSQTRDLQVARKELGIKIPAQVHNHVLVRLDRAYAALRRRRKAGLAGGFPRPRQQWTSLVYPSYGQSHEWLGGSGRHARIRLLGVGDVRVREHQPLPTGDLGQVIVTETRTGRWEIAITVREPIREPLPQTGRSVGINRGVRHLIGTSDGRLVEGLGLRAAAARDLAHARREYARTQRGSAGRERARKRIARIEHRVAAERDRLLGELAVELVRGYDTIVIEDYDSAQMIRRSRDKPGLAARITEQGWTILERRLRDRCERHGRTLVLVNPAGISQTCPRCQRETPHDQGRKRFGCRHCSYEDDRDVAAAKIVLQRADDPEMVRERYGPGDLTQEPSRGERPA